jgi:hypothetical protein
MIKQSSQIEASRGAACSRCAAQLGKKTRVLSRLTLAIFLSCGEPMRKQSAFANHENFAYTLPFLTPSCLGAALLKGEKG